MTNTQLNFELLLELKMHTIILFYFIICLLALWIGAIDCTYSPIFFKV